MEAAVPRVAQRAAQCTPGRRGLRQPPPSAHGPSGRPVGGARDAAGDRASSLRPGAPRDRNPAVHGPSPCARAHVASPTRPQSSRAAGKGTRRPAFSHAAASAPGRWTRESAVCRDLWVPRPEVTLVGLPTEQDFSVDHGARSSALAGQGFKTNKTF